jgi:hypothetical protein
MFRPRLLKTSLPRLFSQRLHPFHVNQVFLLHSDVLHKCERPRVPPPRGMLLYTEADRTADIPDLKIFLERIGRNAATECEDKIRVYSKRFG